MAAISNGSARLNIWVKINGQPARVLINLGADGVYMTPAYTKRLLRRTGMPGAVMVLISIREYDSSGSRNVNSNRKSTRLVPHIIKHWARCSQRGDIELLYISRWLTHAYSCSCLTPPMSSRELGEQSSARSTPWLDERCHQVRYVTHSMVTITTLRVYAKVTEKPILLKYSWQDAYST